MARDGGFVGEIHDHARAGHNHGHGFGLGFRCDQNARDHSRFRDHIHGDTHPGVFLLALFLFFFSLLIAWRIVAKTGSR